MTLQSPSEPARTQLAASPERKNLILVTHPGRQDWRDFEAIGQEIARLAPDIFGYIVSGNDTAESIPREAWQRRSLIVSFGELGRFAPPRGRIFQSAWIAGTGRSAKTALAWQGRRMLMPGTFSNACLSF